MNECAMNDFADGLRRTPPSLLFGHAHSLYLFSSFLKARRPELIVRPKAIISTCMVLHDFERKAIEETFARKVTNRYGCEEVSLIACECEKHEGLHINSDCLLVEIINDHGAPCTPGEPGRVVVTDLTNRAMPIIRYEVGDMAAWSTTSCSCGRTLPLLSKIEGRIADYVVTASGSYISGISLTENFAVQVPGVAQMQIVQEAVDEFTFNIVRGRDFDDDSVTVLRTLVAQRFGTNSRFKCRYVETILPEPSGKYRFCISHVPKEFG
jgi:phenylacetate-CoA ligase